MQELKHVKNVVLNHKWFSDDGQIIIELAAAGAKIGLQEIATAVDHLLQGRQLVLSGGDIVFHSAVDIGHHVHTDVGGLQSCELNRLQELNQCLEKQLAERNDEVTKLSEELKKFQDAVDEYDTARIALSNLSTRRKHERKVMVNRFGHMSNRP